MSYHHILHVSILAFLVVAAIQDYRAREVSNWITIPLFLGGVIVILFTREALPVILSLLLLFFWHKGWMGGADVKVLIALLGIWYQAALAAFFVLGLWGVVLLIKKKQETFPGLVSIAVGSGLTLFGEVSIMSWN